MGIKKSLDNSLDLLGRFLKRADPYLTRIGRFIGGILIILWSSPFPGVEVKPTYWGVPIPNIARWGLLCLGVYFLWSAFFETTKEYVIPNTICPRCQKPFRPEIVKCPGCKLKLEPLEGFYERHPELKGSKEEYPDTMDDLK